MRVTPAKRSDERGATTALFVMFITAFLGCAAFTVDLGHSWQERRNFITATDAAALASAQEYAEGGNGCASVAAAYVDQNRAGATLEACTLSGDADEGFVTVEAEGYVDYIFGDALGIAGTNVSSSSTARWGSPSTVSGGLRPFGLCVDYLEALSPPPVPGNGIEYKMEYGSTSQPSACSADVPGNWSILDFNGGSNPQGEINDWVRDGYPGEVFIGEWYQGNPGAFSNAMRDEMAHLRDNVDCFGLPVFDVANDAGGANAEFRIHEFAGAKLVDYKLTGPQQNRFFTIEFVPCLVQGSGSGPSDLGLKIIGICAVDATDTSGC